MRSGTLRHRVVIESSVNTVDTLGAPVKTWARVAEVQADVSSISGREFFGAERNLSQENYKIFIRVIPGTRIDASFRATDVDTGVVYSITAVLEDHMRSMLTLVAHAGSGHP
jgi:SPP1 family predicted phage head-tail adaptor